MQSIKMDNGFIFHLGRPPLLHTTINLNTVDKLETTVLAKLKDVEKEEEREKRRKFEELHPDDAD